MTAVAMCSQSDLLKLAYKFNCFYLNGLRQGHCKPFIVAGYQVGLIRPDILIHLEKYPQVFKIYGGFVELNPAFRDYKERTSRVQEVLQELKAENNLCTLRGWRNEYYSVGTTFSGNLLEMERSAVCLFGIRNFGVTINGYIQHPSNGLCIWLQQRSETKQTWPGKWDNFVSGGKTVEYGVLETTMKEAAEEASVVEPLSKRISPAGCVSFYFESERGLFPNTEYVYDLELPLDFVPKNADGEVQKFELLTAEDCLRRAQTSEFKTTSIPVLIDFLIRRGIINAENEPNYHQLVELLHIPLQSLYAWPPKNRELAHNGVNSTADGPQD